MVRALEAKATYEETKRRTDGMYATVQVSPQHMYF
jgi:hypothetical protein